MAFSVRSSRPTRTTTPGINWQHPTLSGLRSWWLAHPAWVRPAQSWQDLGPNSHNATLVNMAAVSASSGLGGTSRPGAFEEIRFDGTDDRGTVGNFADYDFPNTTFTVSFWFYSTTAGVQQYLVSKRSASVAEGWMIRIDTDNTVHVSLPTATTAAASRNTISTVTDGRWHHLTAVMKTDTSVAGNNAVTIYLDGRLDQGAQGGGAVPWAVPTTGSLRFGVREDLVNFFAGGLDDVRIYNMGLTSADAWTLFLSSQTGYQDVLRGPRVVVPVTLSTVTVSPAQSQWQPQKVTLTTPPTLGIPIRDVNAYAMGSVIRLYLQTTNPDTGAAWNADALPTYRVYKQNTSPPLVIGTYAALNAAQTTGFYAAEFTIDATLGFEAGQVYAIRSAWTIVDASEAEIEEFTVSTTAIGILPARWQWQAQPVLRDRILTLTPARWCWSPRPVLGPRRLLLTPAQVRWAAQTVLGNSLVLTPARWHWRAAAVAFRPGWLLPPSVRLAWQAQPHGITIPFVPGAPLGPLDAPFIAGDWLLQSQRLLLKLSLTYNPDGTWEHRLLDLSDIEMSVAPGGGLATVANMSFTVAETGEGQSMLARWRRLATIGGTADITLDFRASDGTLLRVFTGIIDTISIRNGRSMVTCVDESIQRNFQLPQTLITSNLYALAADAALAQPLPLVYGYGSHLHAAPLLFTNTSALGYTAAAHAMSMTSQIAFFNANVHRFMPGTVSALVINNAATLFLSTPLQQQTLNPQRGSMAVLSQQAVVFAEAAIDSNPGTLARLYTSARAVNGDGQGLLAVYATPTSDQRGNNQAVVTFTNHRRTPISDPTVTGQFLVQTIDVSTGQPLRSALLTTQNFRHALTPQTTVQTIPNLALGAQEAVEVVLLARNEGGPGGISNFYEIEDISIQTAFVPQGDTSPLFLVGNFNGRRDGTGTVTPTGPNTLYTLPNHLIGSLLLDELGLALSDTIKAANTTYLQRNYTFAGGLGHAWHVSRAPARQVLQDAAWQACAIVAPDLQGKWGLRPFDPNAVPAMTCDPSTILCDEGAQDATGTDQTEVVLGNMAFVHCRFEVHYGWNVGAQKFDQILYAYESGTNAAGRDDLRYRCQLSALHYGITEPLIVEAYWISHPTAALELLSHLVTYFSFQRIVMTVATTLRAVTVRLGDFVKVTHPLLPDADNGGIFEVHSTRITPLSGRVTLTLSKRAVVYLEYFTIRDQTEAIWYWWFDEAGQLVRDSQVPSIPPLTAVDVTGQTLAPHWHRVVDETGTFFYLYPDRLGELMIDTAPPAQGAGLEVGRGLTAIALNARRYRLSASGSPTEVNLEPDIL